MSGPYKNSKGWPLYARMLRQVTVPRTSAEVAARVGICRSDQAAKLLSRMKMYGFIHVTGWRKCHNGYSPIWLVGNGQDAQRPLCADGMPALRKPARPKPSAGMTSFASLLDGLAEPRSRKQLAEYTGCGHTAVQQLIRFAHGLRIVRIADWEKDDQRGRQPVALWEFAIDVADAPRPPPLDAPSCDRRRQQGKRARAEMLAVLRALANKQHAEAA